MYAHVTLPPPAPSTQQPDIPAGLDEVVARGMTKDPQLRYSSAGDLAAAARDALDPPTRSPQDRPRTTRPPGDRLPGDSTTAQALRSQATATHRMQPASARVETRVLPPSLPPTARPRRSPRGNRADRVGLVAARPRGRAPVPSGGGPGYQCPRLPDLFAGIVVSIFGGASSGRLSAGNAPAARWPEDGTAAPAPLRRPLAVTGGSGRGAEGRQFAAAPPAAGIGAPKRLLRPHPTRQL
jgi:hypothetical protein